MPTHSTSAQDMDRSLTQRQLSAIKVIKYLLISSLCILIIGAIVLFGTSINAIITTSSSIDTIEGFGVIELELKRTERLEQQRLSALFSLIINLLIILLSIFGIIIKDNFLLLIIFAIINTIVLIISLWSPTTQAAIVLLQIAVSLFAFSYTLGIYWKMRIELRKKQRNSKEVKNNVKNKVEDNNHQNNHLNSHQNGVQNHNNNPDFDDLKDLKAVIV